MEENIAENLVRPVSPELDAILGKPFKVLDQGFVRVVDYMGNDSSIVQAARVSYGAGTKKVSEDRGLIRYLLRNAHTSPFELCVIKFHVRVPLDTWQQWLRHRTASINQVSFRYSEAIDAMQETDPNEWRSQSLDNKQGSGDFLDSDVGTMLSQREKVFHQSAKELYKERLSLGVAREQARKDLPVSNYTEAYWQINLHNLLHFLKLRLDEKAQLEIRSYATVICNDILKHWCPLSYEAFIDYSLNSTKFSGSEIKILEYIMNNESIEKTNELAKELGFIIYKEDGTIKPNRERDELTSKLKSMNIIAPWLQL